MIRAIFVKALKEQLRNIWILILTLSLAPFFVFIYYLINESEQIHFNVMIHVKHQIQSPQISQDLGLEFISYAQYYADSHAEIPLRIQQVGDGRAAVERLSEGAADVLLIIPEDFSIKLADSSLGLPQISIRGDLTKTAYLIGAVWMGELMDVFVMEQTGRPRLYEINEVPLANSSEVSEFERWMPGMLILSIIMLMFSATIAIVTEVDQKTILRFKLSAVKAGQFLVGVGSVQVLVGLLSLLLTYLAASSLGFENRGSSCLFALISFLSILSMISFSLILAGLTRSVTEVLVIGNFPLFLFMFFTGAAFPIKVAPWFEVGGYGISWQTLLSPTPAIQALSKVSILGQDWHGVIPEVVTLLVLTGLYFILGLIIFQKRHLKTT